MTLEAAIRYMANKCDALALYIPSRRREDLDCNKPAAPGGTKVVKKAEQTRTTAQAILFV